MINNEYPDEDELQKIQTWDYSDFKGLMEFIYEIWKYHEPNPGWCGWKQRSRKYWLHTGGWSGNEEIIGAMMNNNIFWMICWVSNKRGGHYIFELPKEKNG